MTHPLPNSRPVSPSNTPPVGALLAVPLLIAGVMLALSYPVYAAATAIAVAVAVRALQRGLAAHVARHKDRIREVPLPGVGTVRFRISPR